MSDIQIFIPDKDNEGEWRDIDDGLLDLSSHDAKVREEAIDDFVKLVKKHDWNIRNRNEDAFIYGAIDKLAEQLKEQNK